MWVDAFEQATLVYPDVADAQLFVAIAYWNAGNFGEARRYFADAIPRLPEAKEASQQAERSFLQATQSDNPARAWFNVGFFRELNGDRHGAAQAFSRALASGLSEANPVEYARMALERLASDQ